MKISNNNLTPTQIREQAEATTKARRNFILSDYDSYSFDDFIELSYSLVTPTTLGNVFLNRLKHESNGVLKNVNPKDDRGDISCNDKYFEAKFMTVTQNGFYRFTNIRAYQNIDFYIIGLLDQFNNYIKRYYVITGRDLLNNVIKQRYPMSGTAKANEENKNIGECANVNKNDCVRLLEEYNILRGNKSSDLIDFLLYYGHERNNSNEKDVKEVKYSSSIKRKIRVSIRSKAKKIIIYNKNNDSKYVYSSNKNKETLSMFFKSIGIDEIRIGLWDAYIRPYRKNMSDVEVGGYFIDTRLSIRDIDIMFRKFKKHGRKYSYEHVKN